MRISSLLGCSLALMLCLFQNQAFGLQCYVCNSHSDSRCAQTGDKLPDVLKQDCSSLETGTKYTMCRKITQVIEFEVNGMPPDSRVIRGCGWDESNYKGKCYQRSGFGGRQEVCSCTDDNCNSAPRISTSAALLFAIVAPVLSYILS